MRIALLALVLTLPASVASAETADALALACSDLATHQSIRLFFRTGDADGGEAQMRRALKDGTCRQMPTGTVVKVREKSGAFRCVSPPASKAACEWVEATELRP